MKNENDTDCSDITIIKPFVLKTCQLFKDEFSMDVLNVDTKIVNHSIEVNNINFLTTISGNINANLIFSFERTLAKKLLDSFPYLEYTDDIEEEMTLETVAEFLNIVVGLAISDFHDNSQYRFSPPIGLTGESKFFCNKNYNVCKTKLTLKEGSMLIIISTKK